MARYSWCVVADVTQLGQFSLRPGSSDVLTAVCKPFFFQVAAGSPFSVAKSRGLSASCCALQAGSNRRSLGSANTFVRRGVPARAFSRSIRTSVILMNELDKRMCLEMVTVSSSVIVQALLGR